MRPLHRGMVNRFERKMFYIYSFALPPNSPKPNRPRHGSRSFTEQNTVRFGFLAPVPELNIPFVSFKGHLTIPQFVVPLLRRPDARPFKRSSGPSSPCCLPACLPRWLRHFLLLSRLHRSGSGDLDTFLKLNCRHFIVSGGLPPLPSPSHSHLSLLLPHFPGPSRRQTNFAGLNQQLFRNRCLSCCVVN